MALPSIIRMIVSLGIILLMAIPSLAADGFFSVGSTTEKEPWDIEARELSYDKDTDIYTATGDVVLKKGDKTLKCDFAQLHQKTMIAEARGHVEYFSSGDELRGDELTIDLKKQTGEVKNGRLFVKQNHFHVTGEKMWKTGESTYRVVNGTFTSCDGDDVPWKVSSKDFLVTIEGYGEAYHPKFEVKNIPIFYAPYLVFPVKTKRQTGLLFPEPGYSNRDGFTLHLPFYWAISDSVDATLYGYGMSRTGYMQGAEFRYALSPNSKGTFLMDYLFKDLSSAEEYNKGNQYEVYNQRYWFRGKANQMLPGKVDMKLDVDLVSDRDYLKDFRTVPYGLNRSRGYFIGEFGRDLEDQTVIDRSNRALFTRSFGNYTFFGGFQYYQELDKTDNALNQLPFVRLDSTRYQFLEYLYFQWNSSYTYYWRRQMDRGQVLDLLPALFFPYRLGNYLNLEASLGLRETLFQVENRQSAVVDTSASRTIPYMRLDLSSDIQKIFDLEGAGIQKIKHSIRPQVVYDYTPDVSQNNLPTFMGQFPKTNLITYSLTNFLTAKSLVGKGEQGEDLFGYLDFVFLKFYESYDVNEANREVAGSVARKPFSNINAELEIMPGKYFSLRSTAGWSPYSGQLETQFHNLTLNDGKGNYASVEYQTYNTDQTRQINSGLFWKINPQWALHFLNKYSIDQNKSFETTVGLAYIDPCWGIKAMFTGTPENTSFSIAFTLKGLGDLSF